MKRSLVLMSLFVLAGIASQRAAWTQQPANQAEGKARLGLKVYQVVDLLVPSPNYPYRGSELPTTGAAAPAYRGAGAGGAGFGGGGEGTSGGFFQVPPERNFLAQFGGSGISGGGGGIGVSEGQPQRTAMLSLRMDDLIDAIIGVVAPDTWEETGGPGSIRSLGSMLLVNQTEEVHRGIEHLLGEIRAQGGAVRTVTVAARWLALDEAQRSQLVENGKPGTVLDREALKNLAANATAYQGQVTCHSGQTVHIVSGTRHSVVIGAIPVVGGQVVGHQPLVAYPNAGVLLQVTPLLLPGGQAASLDVQSSVTFWQDPERLAVSTGESGLSIDRVRLAANQLATTVRMPVGKPVLVGGLTMVDDAPQKPLYLVIELTVDEGERPAAPGAKAK